MPVDSQHDNQVGELAESEQCTAEYQAESSADVTHQSQRSVGRFGFRVLVLQLRVVDLGNNAIGFIRHDAMQWLTRALES